MSVVPICCPSCGNDKYRETNKTLAASQARAMQCTNSMCGWWFSAVEGRRAFEARNPPGVDNVLVDTV